MKAYELKNFLIQINDDDEIHLEVDGEHSAIIATDQYGYRKGWHVPIKVNDEKENTYT